MAGVIGTRKFAYDVWGDTVNIVSRIEAACQPTGYSYPQRQQSISTTNSHETDLITSKLKSTVWSRRFSSVAALNRDLSCFAQTPAGRRGKQIIDTRSQRVRFSIPEPIRVSVRSLRNMSGERKHHANAFNAGRGIAEASAARRSRRCRRNYVCWLLLGRLVSRQHR